MSYEIIKKIKVRDNKVFITCASNNVIPRTPHEFESTSLTNTLQEQGQQEVDILILKEYVSGSFQGGSNKYTRALKVLLHMPEYKDFDWRQKDYDLYKKNMAERKEEYNALLLKALNTKLPKEKFVIYKEDYRGNKVYFYSRANSSFCRWYDNPLKAKVFNYYEDAENQKKYYQSSDDWKIISI